MIKKSFLTGFFCCAIFISLNAQVVFEHTISHDWVWPFNTENETMFIAKSDNQVYIYNGDYSLYKTVNVSGPAGSIIQTVQLASDKLFNDDSSIEFVCSFYNSTSYTYTARLYNENGQQLLDFGSGVYNCYSFETVAGEYKLIAMKLNENETDFYSLPGTLSEVESSFSLQKDLAYPNPSKDHIIIQYNLEKNETKDLGIFDLKGNLIETIKIGSHFQQVKINVSEYNTGSYIYKYKEVSGSFIVQ